MRKAALENYLQHDISAETFYTWMSKYTALTAHNQQNLRELERDNASLHKIITD